MMNKKAGERILSFYMFIIFGIIAVGILIGVYWLYSALGDIRKIEAEIITARIADCIVEQGKLIEKYNEKFDVFSECKLNKEILENPDLYFFKIEIKDINGGNKFEPILAGNPDYEVYCEAREENTKAENWPECWEEKIYALKSEEEVLIRIIGASNNLGGRLK